MTVTDFASTMLIIAWTSYTCRTCQFPVYLQTSVPEATRRRDWRARSRSSRVASSPLRVTVDGGTLSWNGLEHDDELIYSDHCQREITHIPGLYTDRAC